jgi:heme exporter protein D
MMAEFILMNGYGLYVWSSFSVVLISCVALYLRTKKTLKKYENDFLIELQNLSAKEKNKVLENSKVAQHILAANTKIN